MAGIGADGGFFFAVLRIASLRAGLLLVPLGKLADVADAACAVQIQLTVEGERFRLADEVGQGGLAGAVAADEGAVTAGLQGKVDGMV